MPPRIPPGQLDLLAWDPPQPVARFEPERVRGASHQQQIARAVGACLKDAEERGVGRDAIADAMTVFLGEAVSKHMLDAYASQARTEHVINLPRFMALLHATSDRRLLELIAEPMGWAVVERKHLAMIELAQLHEAQEVLRRRTDALRRQAKIEGAL